MQAWLFCTTGKFCFDNGAAEKGTLLFLSQFFLSGLCHDWAYCWKLLENLLSVPGKWGNVLADCPLPPLPPTVSSCKSIGHIEMLWPWKTWDSWSPDLSLSRAVLPWTAPFVPPDRHVSLKRCQDRVADL